MRHTRLGASRLEAEEVHGQTGADETWTQRHSVQWCVDGHLSPNGPVSNEVLIRRTWEGLRGQLASRLDVDMLRHLHIPSGRLDSLRSTEQLVQGRGRDGGSWARDLLRPV